MATSLWGKGFALIKGFWNGIANRWEGVGQWLGGMFGRVKDAIGNLAGALWDAGWHAINGLWSGLKNRWDSVAHWLGGIKDKIKNLKGPIDKDKVMLVNEGQAIMEGLNTGLVAGFGNVQRTLRGITLSVQNPQASPNNETSYNTSFNAPIYIRERSDADHLLGQLMRDDEVRELGMTPRRNIYGS